MSGCVEMTRNSSETHGRDRFACSHASWQLLQEIGLAGGWQQLGTTYLAPANLKVEMLARHDYQPGDALDFKRVDGEDATAWALALDKAKDSARLDALIDDWSQRLPDCPSGTATVISLIFEFTEYAYGGEFVFANAATHS